MSDNRPWPSKAKRVLRGLSQRKVSNWNDCLEALADARAVIVHVHQHIWKGKPTGSVKTKWSMGNQYELDALEKVQELIQAVRLRLAAGYDYAQEELPSLRKEEAESGRVSARSQNSSRSKASV